MRTYAILLMLGGAGCSTDTFGDGDAAVLPDGGDFDAFGMDVVDDKNGHVVDGPPLVDAVDDEWDGFDGYVPPRIVFVTSSTFEADLGGIAGADGKCQAAASAAGLSGTFYAWLSTSATSPSSHFTRAGAGWARVDGKPVAASSTWRSYRERS